MAAIPPQGAVDPWLIQPRERERYEEQFKSLNPINGIVTGDQAKGFLLQSRLPPKVLALIWGLADTDSDGKMNINEFSIACKLINLKLRGFELPQTLPPSLLQITKVPPTTAPAAPVAGNLILNGTPPIPPFPSAANMQRVSAVPTMAVAPMGIQPAKPVPVMGTAPITTQPTAPMMPASMGIPLVPGVGAAPPLIPQVPSTMAPGIPPGLPPPVPRMPTMGTSVPTSAGIPPLGMAPVGGIPGVPQGPLTGTAPVQGTMPLSGIPPGVGAPIPPAGVVPGAPIPIAGVPPGQMPLGGVPVVPGAPRMPGMPLVPGVPNIPVSGIVGMPGPGVAPVVPGAPAVPRPPGVVPLPLSQTTPGPPSLAGTPNSVGSGGGGGTSERLGSIDLGFGSPVLEWAVPHQSKLKYTQMFNTIDRARTGFLSGLQAGSIMMNTGLPQKALAQIWALADMDSDGRLSSDEFVLAMHLCDMAKTGDKIPPVLPLELIPPAFRRQQQQQQQQQQAIASAVTSPPGLGPEKIIDQDAAATLMNNVTFEDKRKENFEKGQAELERRRKSLLEIQRKEQEERERKEREEQEKREKIRLEQERRRQEEMEKQLQRQREIEQEREQQIRYQQEQREAARRELERQRQLEWEKQRSQELQQARQREQEKVLRLKAQNQSLGIELSQLNEKVKELTNKISETRLGVSNVKTMIDGMRGTRDTQMAEMTALKAKLKEQNNRLLSVTAEKARLEQKNKRNQELGEANKECMAEAAANKQIALKQLKDRLADLETEITAKVDDLKNNNTQLGDLKSELSTLVSECETLYSTYEERKAKVKPMKSRMRSDPNEAWGDAAWNTAPERSSSWPEDGDVVIPSTGKKALLRYRALYEFVARSGDEISFQPGDIILVPMQQNAEPGWLAGEIRGHTGWFPESYVEPIDIPKPAVGEAGDLPGEKMSPGLAARALEGIAEVPENAVDTTAVVEASIAAAAPPADEPVEAPAAPAASGDLPPEEQEYYTALYPYQSTEAGDLCFQQGEVVLVVKKEGDWWTGVIGDRTGIFPSNYVQKAEDQPSVTATAPTEPEEPTVEPVVEEPAVKEEPPAQTEAQPAVQEKPATPDFAALNSSTPGSKSKKPEIATVMAPYTATSAEQLNLSRGQLIMIRKKSNTGWWEGELQAKGQKRQVGWFPASYVKLLGGTGARKSSDVSASNTPPPSASPIPTATGAETNLEKVVALFQYTAQNEDELSFEKDDVITLLAKEEAAWWRGELNGVSGLFPSNYVAPISVGMLRGTERKRQESIDELINTEQAYIDDMSIVHDVFEKPLIEKQVLTPELVQKIFVNWEEIIVCNYMFLRALRVRREMSSGGIIRMIGDILCENLPRMNVYVRFCSCQLSAAATLQMLTETNAEFREATRHCQNDIRTKGMPLSSFLIKPMQRITKYPLLIKKILKYTPADHPDFTYLQEALSKAEEFCNQVNEGVREKENSDRLEWLQQHVLFDGLEEKITFNSLTNCLGPRKFLHYGVLIKAKSGKELVAFLMNDFLLLTRPSKSLGSGRQFSFERCSNIYLKLYKAPIILSEMRILDESSNGNGKTSPLDGILGSGDTSALRIEHVESKTVHSFLAPSTTERNLWYKKLEAAQKNFLEKEQGHFQRQQSKQAQFGAVGRVLAVVVSGSGFTPSSAGGKSEIFCKVSMGSQGQRTPVAAGPNPQWQASMQFLVKDLQEDSLCITVFERGQFRPDEFLGRTEIRIQDISQTTGRMPGPITKQLKLHEVDSGEVEVKLDLRLFHR